MQRWETTRLPTGEEQIAFNCRLPWDEKSTHWPGINESGGRRIFAKTPFPSSKVSITSRSRTLTVGVNCMIDLTYASLAPGSGTRHITRERKIARIPRASKSATAVAERAETPRRNIFQHCGFRFHWKDKYFSVSESGKIRNVPARGGCYRLYSVSKNEKKKEKEKKEKNKKKRGKRIESKIR